jgi:hypothetical protein
MEAVSVVRIVKGMKVGRNRRLATKAVHLMKSNDETECGINIWNSEILGVSEEGSVEDVTCVRCVKRSNAKRGGEIMNGRII